MVWARVALLLERSAGAVVAILAVLKTGAAYFAIDPSVPAARITFKLADAAPMAEITTTGLADRLAGHDVPVIDVNGPGVDTNPALHCRAPGADDIAYIVYTSGTTRVPKGWPSPTATSPSCWSRGMPACRAQVCGREWSRCG